MTRTTATIEEQAAMSRERRTMFATGAIRDENVAGQTAQFPMRFDLLISNTDFMKRMAATYGEGGIKYTDDNWRNGMPEKSLVNHCLAHVIQHLEGDKTEDHLAHAIWNLMTLMWVQVNMPQLLDLTALVAKGKLQPCNFFDPDPKAEASAPKFTEREPNEHYRKFQQKLAQTILDKSEIYALSDDMILLNKAKDGVKLGPVEYTALTKLFINLRP